VARRLGPAAGDHAHGEPAGGVVQRSCPFLGSAQRLSNGNFHFTTSALIKDVSFGARAIEVTPEGKVIYILEISGALIYRGNRVVDLYTPPVR